MAALPSLLLCAALLISAPGALAQRPSDSGSGGGSSATDQPQGASGRGKLPAEPVCARCRLPAPVRATDAEEADQKPPLSLLHQTHNAPAGAPGPLIISEFLAAPAAAAAAAAGAAAQSSPPLTLPNAPPGAPAAPDWVELSNPTANAVSLGGWALAAGRRAWRLPAGVEVPAGGRLVLVDGGAAAAAVGGDGDSDTAAAAVEGAAGARLLAVRDLRLGREAPLTLRRPDGSVASATGEVTRQLDGVAFGVAGSAAPAAPESPAAGAPGSFTFLQAPTPGAPNAAALPHGPFIFNVSLSSSGGAGAPPPPADAVPPGEPLNITARIAPNAGAPLGAVTLVWRVNYDPEQRIAMAPSAADANGGVSAGAGTTYTAMIPGAALKAGDMVRWAVVAESTAAGAGAGAPPPSRAPPADGAYFGAAVAAPPAAAAGALPLLRWFAADARAAQSDEGAPASLAFNGSFYDNVAASRRGVTSLAWAKPKMSFKAAPAAAGGRDFILFDGNEYGTLKLNSLYFELGENSFMKEAVAARVMAEEGLAAPLVEHIEARGGGLAGFWGRAAPCTAEHSGANDRQRAAATIQASKQPPTHPNTTQVFVNGRYAGLYGLVEDAGGDFLRVHARARMRF